MLTSEERKKYNALWIQAVEKFSYAKLRFECTNAHLEAEAVKRANRQIELIEEEVVRVLEDRKSSQ